MPVLTIALGASMASLAGGQSAPLGGFDEYVTQAMRDWKVPGLAIAIVRNDSIVLMKAYGSRTIGKTEPVNEHTMFAIDADGKVKSVDVEGLGTFGRRTEKPDSTKRADR